MLNLKQAIADDIAKAAGEEVDVVVKRTDDPSHGDYASPVALSLAKKLKKNPMDLVKEIVGKMEKKEYIGRIEAAEPGFLNVWISPGWMTARLDNVVQEDLNASMAGDPSTSLGVKGKSVSLEFVSANPTGPMTLGNARTAFAADTLANVFECAGYNVTREYYINDAGRQVQRLGESVLRRILQAQPFDEAQGKGAEIDFPEDLYQGGYIAELGETIAERWREDEGKVFEPADLEDKEILEKISREAVDLAQAANRKTAEEVLQVEFDVWMSERKLREDGKVEASLEKLRRAGKTYKKDGAEWLKTSEHGDDKDRVLVKKDGEYAYLAPDIAYFEDKFERKFDKIFTFLGADHLGHVPSMLAAMDMLGYDTAKLVYLVASWVRFTQAGEDVKISKRAGQIVTPKDLIDEVGYDVARFFMLQYDLKSHMLFDLALAKERSEKNPVYYVQYAYVRLQSILRRAKEEGVIKDLGETIELTSRAELTHTTEINLMKQIYRLPEVVSDIAANYAVHGLNYFAHDLAQAVHVFYKHVPVLAEENEEVRNHRLQLVLAAKQVLGKTLELLGIGKPDVM